jgi:hypothetical protein
MKALRGRSHQPKRQLPNTGKMAWEKYIVRFDDLREEGNGFGISLLGASKSAAKAH